MGPPALSHPISYLLFSSQGMSLPPISPHVYKLEGANQCLGAGNHRALSESGLAGICPWDYNLVGPKTVLSYSHTASCLL